MAELARGGCEAHMRCKTKKNRRWFDLALLWPEKVETYPRENEERLVSPRACALGEIQISEAKHLGQCLVVG